MEIRAFFVFVLWASRKNWESEPQADLSAVVSPLLQNKAFYIVYIDAAQSEKMAKTVLQNEENFGFSPTRTEVF